MEPHLSAVTENPEPAARGRSVTGTRKRGLEERPLFYLLYILFYFTEWFFVPITLIDIGVGVGAVIVFALVYAFAMAKAAPVVIAAAVFALTLSLGLTPFVGVSGTFAIYAITLCASLRPARFSLAAMAVALCIYAAGSLAIYFSALDVRLPIFEVAFTSFLGIMAGLAAWSGFNTSERTDIRERRLRLDAELAAARERERIARDLHDVLGHTLTTIAVKSDLAVRLLGSDDGAAKREIEEIRDASRSTLKEVRAAVSGMHRTTLEAELDRARTALESVDITLDIDGETGALPSQQASTLGMALREAATNVLRHSKANHVQVQIEHDAAKTSLIFEDNGGADTPIPGGGLTGMRGRLETLGGSLDIGQGKAGVRLVMRLPVKPSLEDAS